MSLFGTIYLGKSGVNTMSYGINVTADNVANLESTGFRASKPLFEDIFLSTCSEAPPYDQKGLGVNLKAIEVLYQEGPIQNTNNFTDMAIMGKGFFTVTDGERFFYTRDGCFLLQEAENGYLKISTPSGYDLCGWQCPQGVDASTIESGILAPIKIPSSVSGKGTSNIVLQLNCDVSTQPEEENISLLEKWNGLSSEPISPDAYDFKIDLPIWDDLGNQHTISMYIDNTDESQVFEFLVAIDPSKDWRGTGKYSGCLLTGLLNFDANGQLDSIENLTLITDPSGTTQNIDPSNLTNGLPYFIVNFTGNEQEITLDFGVYFDNENNQWVTNQTRTSTAYASPFNVVYQYVDGYPAGVFESFHVTPEGVIEARYTNNQIFDIARIPLALFNSPDELERVGGNLFKSVKDAEPKYFPPGYDVPGIILGGALEGSNVDLANEMTQLIMLQRTFQSNVRVITTADQMLDDFIRSV